MRTRSLGSGIRSALELMLACGVALALAPACSLPRSTPDRIVLVVVDTLRRDALGVYGAATTTPAIDALAARGRAYSGLVASFHQTSMSMGGLFSGRTPSIEAGEQRGILGWNGRTWCGLARFAGSGEEPACVPAALETLGEVLHDAGYWTAAVVTNRMLFRPAGFDAGFDEWVELQTPEPGEGRSVDPRRAGVDAATVNRTAQQVLETRPGDRFFLYLHYMDVHDYMLHRVPYASRVDRVDRAIGELMAMLEREGLLAGSVVILTSDHGESLVEQHLIPGRPGHLGNPAHDEQLLLPLIVAPAEFAPREPMLRSQDLFALISRIAGTARRLPQDTRQDELFLSEQKWHTYRQGRFKSCRARHAAPFYLFDLERDPGERVNVAAEHPEVTALHLARIDALARELAPPAAPPSELTPADEQVLRALGYLE